MTFDDKEGKGIVVGSHDSYDQLIILYYCVYGIKILPIEYYNNGYTFNNIVCIGNIQLKSRSFEQRSRSFK